MTMLITVTNVYFAEAKSLVLGHGNRYSMDKDIHAYLMGKSFRFSKDDWTSSGLY